jgi:hypothetical protein
MESSFMHTRTAKTDEVDELPLAQAFRRKYLGNRPIMKYLTMRKPLNTPRVTAFMIFDFVRSRNAIQTNVKTAVSAATTGVDLSRLLWVRCDRWRRLKPLEQAFNLGSINGPSLRELS